MNDEPKPPVVFLSHAHEDKERFVNPLDGELRARGLEVTLDTRIPAGDNLVTAIFEQGLSASDAVAVVLSANRIDAPWVREEYSVAVVQRIAGIVKRVIPIRLDCVEMPAVFAATKWVVPPSPDAAGAERAAQEIADAVFGAVPPPVAPPPPYAGVAVHGLPDTTANDERILALAGELHVDRDLQHPAVNVDDILERATRMGISEAVVSESLRALEQYGYLSELHWTYGRQTPLYVELSSYGLETYLEAYRPEQYRDTKRILLGRLAISRGAQLFTIVAETGISQPIAWHIAEQLESGGYARVSWHNQGASMMPEPTIRRLLEALENER